MNGFVRLKDPRKSLLGECTISKIKLTKKKRPTHTFTIDPEKMNVSNKTFSSQCLCLSTVLRLSFLTVAPKGLYAPAK